MPFFCQASRIKPSMELCFVERSSGFSDHSSAALLSPATAQSNSFLNQFRLSTTDKWIGGICGGLATLTNVPAWSWRILFLMTALLHGIGVLVYVLLWIFVPVQSVAIERASGIAEGPK